MDWWVWLGLGIVAFFLLRKPFRQFRMGQHMSRMATVFEEIEATRHRNPIGAGGDIDSLPIDRKVRALAVLREGASYLNAFPRHVVTRELVKNALLAEQMGRSGRAVAINNLIDCLAAEGVALHPDEFMKSYV